MNAGDYFSNYFFKSHYKNKCSDEASVSVGRSASALNSIQQQYAINFVDWMLYGREKWETRNPKYLLCREVFLSLPVSCQHQFFPWLPGGVSGLGIISRSSGDRGHYFVNSHHRMYRWTLYIWHGALNSQITKISLLGFVWKVERNRHHQERLYPILQEVAGRDTSKVHSPGCPPLNAGSKLKHLKLDVTNLYSFFCGDDNITLKLQRYLVY